MIWDTSGSGFCSVGFAIEEVLKAEWSGKSNRLLVVTRNGMVSTRSSVAVWSLVYNGYSRTEDLPFSPLMMHLSLPSLVSLLLVLILFLLRRLRSPML